MSKVKFKIIDGGKAIPIGNNLYKLIGRSHEEGGIGIELKDGNAKTVIEGERDEIFEPKTHEFRMFSDSIKIGNKTPAQLAEAGYNPDIIFKAQQSINGNYGGSYAEDGSKKEIKKENIPTKEEYITQKLDSIRNDALERSRNKTQAETTTINEADVYGKKQLIDFLQNEYNDKLFLYNRFLEDRYDNYKKNNPITSEKYTKLDFIENNVDFKYYYEQLNNAKNLLEDAKNGKYNGKALNNCIANLSEMFPHGLPYGNQTFKANPKKYGFSLIDTHDVLPGDLIQHLNYNLNGQPDHAMIYNGIDKNGKHTFNYSDGGEPSMREGIVYGGYGSNKKYPKAVAKDGKHLWDVNVYRYTGTPQDSIQWSNEYDQKYGKTLKNGGLINMKLKHKNKQDITDMVMNEILPHSTGERKKFDGGGVWGTSEWSLAGNLGLNTLNALTQGILGSVFGNKAIDMYTKAKSKLKKTFTPVAREHIDTRVDIENELSGIKQSTAKLIENAKANTSNAKVARLQAQNAIKQQNELEHRAYTNKYKEESNRRNIAAELATKYNIIDNQNYIQSEREYQDKMLQLDLGIANAEISKGQTWGNDAGSALKAGADSLTDYATMTNDLLKSNNSASYVEYMKRNYGRFLNPDGTLKDKYKGNTRIENFYNKNLKPLFTPSILTPTIIPYSGGLLT